MLSEWTQAIVVKPELALAPWKAQQPLSSAQFNVALLKDPRQVQLPLVPRVMAVN